MKKAIPTLGYRTQSEAICALYEQRIEPKTIAGMVEASVNVVHRAISDYRSKTGRVIPPIRERQPTPAIAREHWNDSPYERALAAHRRAVRGARKTLEMMQ